MMRSAALTLSASLVLVPAVASAQPTAGAPGSLDATRPGAHAQDSARAITCMAAAIAYEAGFEPLEGQQAVAEVILNRLRRPAFPKSVCGVVFAGAERRTGCQFSFACDGSLGRRMSATVMAHARIVAASALEGLNPVRVPGATHYHADYVSPYWAPSLIRITKIGAHIFYRGAGAPDYAMGGIPYAPLGEPMVSKLDGVTVTSATSRASSLIPERPEAPRVFAPWGLLPPSSAAPAGS